mmetsp:Transcript_7413/g.24172  ORF Transcript_7413/g.24172 Transcript_7413/m.24172 type:complete len:668 (-) Transcript_7413:114-2117(-)
MEPPGGLATFAWAQRGRSKVACCACAQCGTWLFGPEEWCDAGRAYARAAAGDLDGAEVCAAGCGLLYCGAPCRGTAAAAHALTCVGDVDEHHARYKFKLGAMASPWCDEILLAAHWLAAAAVDGEDPWAHVAAPAAVDLGDAGKLWRLLKKGAFEERGHYAARTAADFARLVGHVARTRLPANSANPLVAVLRRHYLSGEVLVEPLRSAVVSQCADRVADKWHAEMDRSRAGGGGGGEDDDDEEAEDDAEEDDDDWEDDDEDDAAVELRADQVLAWVLAEPQTFFPPLEALSVVRGEAPPHSCDATLAADCGAAGARLAVALRRTRPDDVGGEEASIARHSAEELKVLGCRCAACLLAAGDVAQLEPAQLKRLARRHRRDEAYKRSEQVDTELLKRDPLDGDALYSYARVAAWSGRWAAWLERLEEARVLAPGHTDVLEALANREAYFVAAQGAAEDATVAARPLPPPACDGVSGEASTVCGETLTILCGRGRARRATLGVDAFVVEGALDGAALPRLCAAVEAQCGGSWTTSRHYSVPTTDVPVRLVGPVLRWLNAELEANIWPAVAQLFRVEESSLRVADAFFVKYDAQNGQRDLPLHCDQAHVSLTIPMNARADYSGGGTYVCNLCQRGRAGNTDRHSPLFNRRTNNLRGARDALSTCCRHDPN